MKVVALLKIGHFFSMALAFLRPHTDAAVSRSRAAVCVRPLGGLAEARTRGATLLREKVKSIYQTRSALNKSEAYFSEAPRASPDASSCTVAREFSASNKRTDKFAFTICSRSVFRLMHGERGARERRKVQSNLCVQRTLRANVQMVAFLLTFRGR